jgi:phage terminase large subunit
LAEIEARFPPKLEFLFKPSRYKVAYGGRGGAKSWGFARALLLRASAKPLRVLCTREVQKSIKDSVHQLLNDQVQSLGLGAFYDVLATEIRGRNGSKFIFSGLSDQTAESIKSFEGIDIVWVEEAQAVTKRSWNILIPTIRKPESEIWVSLNPELDTDETYTRFVVNPPPDAQVVKVNWQDNPWFPETLEQERAYSQRTDPDNYDNIWEGATKAAVEGAIYAAEITAMQENGQICNVPYEPRLKVHVVCDLGFNDQMSIGMYQRQLSELRMIDYMEDSQQTLDWYSAELRKKNYNWGKLWLPHDAKHKTLAAGGNSTEAIMRKLSWDVELVPDIGIEQGIKVTRMALKRTYIDKTKCARLVECLKRYRRSVPTTTGEPGSPVHDQYSHGADMKRYASIVAERMKNDNKKFAPLKYDHRGIV